MRRSRPPTHLGKGQMGSALIGVTANFMFLTEFVLGVLPLAYFYIPKSSRACLFPQSVKIHYFCSGPISSMCSSAKRFQLEVAPSTAGQKRVPWIPLCGSLHSGSTNSGSLHTARSHIKLPFLAETRKVQTRFRKKQVPLEKSKNLLL